MDEALAIQSAADEVEFFVNESVAITGFTSAFCRSRANAFEGHIADTDPNQISYRLDLGDAEPDIDFELCQSLGNGRVTITPLRAGTYPAQIIAEDSNPGNPGEVVLANFTAFFQVREPFMFRGECDQAVIETLDSQINAITPTTPYNLNSDMHDVAQHFGTLLRTPALNFSQCPLNEMFINFESNIDGTPAIFFDAVTKDLTSTNATSVGEIFVIPATGELYIVLLVPGEFTIQLTASSSGVTVVILEFSLLVRQGNPITNETCVNGVPDPNDEVTHGCNCGVTGFTGDTCAITDGNEGSDALLLGLVLGFLALFLILFIIWRVRHKRRKMMPHDFEETLADIHLDGKDTLNGRVIPEELARSSIVLVSELGSGEFGTVHKGLYMPQKHHSNEKVFEYAVAVKCLKDDSGIKAREDFMREAAITAQFDHDNVVGLIGVVTRGTSMLVIQFCELGALDSILQKEERPTSELIGYAQMIATGMSYLASRSFVHRDLAARNVLIDAKGTAKVADFGLSRDIDEADYYTSTDQNARLPLRWMAPEVFETRHYGEASDVWAYGITLIEIFTRAKTPYPGWSNIYVSEKVKEGYKLPCPDSCPPKIYENVIAPSLSHDPTQRPPFTMITSNFSAFKNFGVTETQTDTDHVAISSSQLKSPKPDIDEESGYLKPFKKIQSEDELGYLKPADMQKQQPVNRENSYTSLIGLEGPPNLFQRKSSHTYEELLGSADLLAGQKSDYDSPFPPTVAGSQAFPYSTPSSVHRANSNTLRPDLKLQNVGTESMGNVSKEEPDARSATSVDNTGSLSPYEPLSSRENSVREPLYPTSGISTKFELPAPSQSIVTIGNDLYIVESAAGSECITLRKLCISNITQC